MSGLEVVNAKKITKVLDEATEKVRGPTADPADLRKLEETCELLLAYHDPGANRKEGQVYHTRFSMLPTEALDHLAAVCIEHCSPHVWQKAVEELSASKGEELHVDLTAKAIGCLLHKTQDEDILERVTSLIQPLRELKNKVEVCGKIRTAYEESLNGEE
jgi:hypothetical protein